MDLELNNQQRLICHKTQTTNQHESLYLVVVVPKADKFNQIVCMDLKEHIQNKTWILYMTDSASRHLAACLVFSKQQDEIVQTIQQMWISYFDARRKFLNDNGGEFLKEKYKKMNEKLNIETATTAGESLFSSGFVEQHNQILAETSYKRIADAKCEQKITLACAVSAKDT